MMLRNMSSINVLTGFVKENMKKIHALFEQHQQKPSYPRVWERSHSTWGKTVTRRFLPHIFPGLIIAVYFVAYNVE